MNVNIFLRDIFFTEDLKLNMLMKIALPAIVYI